MPKKSMDLLTESMFYVLMALYYQPKCGIDIAAFIEERTGGRLRIGPATLYTILGKFEKEKLIEEKLEADKRAQEASEELERLKSRSFWQRLRNK